MTEAIIGWGSTFQSKIAGVWVTLGEVVDISFSGQGRDLVEDTHFTSTGKWETQIASLKRSGDIAVTANFIAAQYIKLENELNSDDAVLRRIVFPNGDVLPFTALLKGLDFTITVGEKIAAQASFKVIGQPGPLVTLPFADNVAPMLFADFVNDVYWNDGTAYEDFAAWMTSIGGTFTRNLAATYFNQQGLLTTAAVDTARFRYDPLTHARSGLFLEWPATNALFQSNTFSNASWTKNNINDTTFSNAITGPDGVAGSAKKLTENTTNGDHSIFQVRTKAASALTYVFSLFAKAAERSRVQLRFNDGAGTNNAWAVFDLAGKQVGVQTTAEGNFTAVAGSARIEELVNGWCRCSFAATTNTVTSVAPNIFVDSGTGTGGQSITFAGVNGQGIYIFGAQIEQHANLSSYIETTTVAVTRPTDLLQASTAYFGGTTQGAIYARVNGQRAENISHRVFFNSTVDANNRHWFSYRDAAQIDFTAGTFKGGANPYSPADGGTPNFTDDKVAYSFASNGGIFVGNGVLIGTATTDLGALMGTTFQLGDTGFQPLQGFYKEFATWNFRPTSATMLALTV